MFKQAFKNIHDSLWKDAGCSSEPDNIEQTSWVLFLKYLHGQESERETATILNAESYNAIIDNPLAYRFDVGFDLKGDCESKPLTDGLPPIRYLFG